MAIASPTALPSLAGGAASLLAALLFDALAGWILFHWLLRGRPRPWQVGLYIALSLPFYALFAAVLLGQRALLQGDIRFWITALTFPVLAIKLSAVGLYPVYALLVRWKRPRPQAAPGAVPTPGRRRFLQRSMAAAAGLPGAALVYGIARGSDRLRLHTLEVACPGLPEAFDGLRIVQLSDIHTGSFLHRDLVRRGVERTLALAPDLICFTGDLVNELTQEAEPFAAVLRRLEAPLGVYSILGNHDYGDYFRFSSQAARERNFARMLQLHERMGWQLLRNQHLRLRRRGATLPLIGCENWSRFSRFRRYGDLSQAVRGTEADPFALLLSHDPTHWEAQVLDRYPHIGLTLSGHTHGMQFGIDSQVFRWSPVQYLYPHWAGLYGAEGRQRLYVNRGLGFIGYPGRLGVWPEITLLILRRVPASA